MSADGRGLYKQLPEQNWNKTSKQAANSLVTDVLSAKPFLIFVPSFWLLRIEHPIVPICSVYRIEI